MSRSAFITSRDDSRSRSTVLHTARPRIIMPKDNLKSINDNDGDVTKRHEVTPRAARIEMPLQTLLGSGLMWMPVAAPVCAAQDGFAVFESTMRKYFPQALPTAVVSNKVRAALADRKFSRTNTLFGASISPDEINTKPKESLSVVLEEYLSKHSGIYCLGGIGGLPMQGVRGMAEFLSHSPRKGRVLILFGPNLGIADNGTIGMIERLGQKRLSECCEPGLNTFDALQARIKSEKESSTAYDELDSQMQFILENLQKYVDTPKAVQVSKSAIPAYITVKMFELGKDMITEQLEACLPDEARREIIMEVVILGGIIINRGQILGSIEPREDYFLPLVFESYNGEVDLEGNLEKSDLFGAVFGGTPASLDVRT